MQFAPIRYKESGNSKRKCGNLFDGASHLTLIRAHTLYFQKDLQISEAPSRTYIKIRAVRQLRIYQYTVTLIMIVAPKLISV